MRMHEESGSRPVGQSPDDDPDTPAGAVTTDQFQRYVLDLLEDPAESGQAAAMCRRGRVIALTALCLTTGDRCMLPPGHPGTRHLIWWDDA